MRSHLERQLSAARQANHGNFVPYYKFVIDHTCYGTINIIQVNVDHMRRPVLDPKPPEGQNGIAFRRE